MNVLIGINMAMKYYDSRVHIKIEKRDRLRYMK